LREQFVESLEFILSLMDPIVAISGGVRLFLLLFGGGETIDLIV